MPVGLLFPGAFKIVHQRCEDPGGVVGAQQIHIAVEHLGGVILRDGHYRVPEGVAGVPAPDKVQDRRAEGVVHHAVQLPVHEVPPPAVIGHLVGGVLPHLAQQQGVGLQLLQMLSQQFQKFVRQLVRHIQPETIGAQTNPVGDDAVGIRNDIADKFRIQLVHRGQGVKAPPGVVGIRPVAEGVPAVVGGSLALVGSLAGEGPLLVEIQAVGAGVGVDSVQDHPHPPVVSRPAEGSEIGLRAQHGIGGLVVAGVIAVGGEALADGVQVQQSDAQLRKVGQLLGDAPEIAAEKIVVQHHSLGGGLPVYLLVPVLVEGVGLELPGKVGMPGGTKPVGEDLVDGGALGPVRGGEVRRDTAQLPQIPGLHVGIVPLLVQPEGAFPVMDAEEIEVQAGFRQGEGHPENIVGTLLQLEVHVVGPVGGVVLIQ